jgi:D-xylulose reductase
MPTEPVPIDIVAAAAREARIETIFRYAHVYPRALALMESGKIDLTPLVTDAFSLDDGVKAFDYALRPKPTSVKVQIQVQE